MVLLLLLAKVGLTLLFTSNKNHWPTFSPNPLIQNRISKDSRQWFMAWSPHLSFLLKNLHPPIWLFLNCERILKTNCLPSSFPTYLPMIIFPQVLTTRKLKEVHGLDRWSQYTHDRDRGSSRPEKDWNWYEVDWAPFRKVWFKSASSKMISLSYSRLVMSHDPTFSCLFSRGIISSLLFVLLLLRTLIITVLFALFSLHPHQLMQIFSNQKPLPRLNQ